MEDYYVFLFLLCSVTYLKSSIQVVPFQEAEHLFSILAPNCWNCYYSSKCCHTQLCTWVVSRAVHML